jgi:RNA-directed DNA polymerase
MEKYFKPSCRRKWLFATEYQAPNGKPKLLRLVKASDTRIRRRAKVKGEANPFDPKWETYFEDRLGLKMKDTLKGRKRWLNLWRNQAGRCPMCSQRLTKETKWHVHHVLPKSEGGKDNAANLVLVHPNCHRQIHSRKLKVVKPAPARGL